MTPINLPQFTQQPLTPDEIAAPLLATLARRAYLIQWGNAIIEESTRRISKHTWDKAHKPRQKRNQM